MQKNNFTMMMMMIMMMMKNIVRFEVTVITQANIEVQHIICVT